MSNCVVLNKRLTFTFKKRLKLKINGLGKNLEEMLVTYFCTEMLVEFAHCKQKARQELEFD